ncbi:three-helix bundle dimerization domain-containing protein [Streptomyces sp. NPDC059382]
MGGNGVRGLRYARVRTYLPILMERRARNPLSPDEHRPVVPLTTASR